MSRHRQALGVTAAACIVALIGASSAASAASGASGAPPSGPGHLKPGHLEQIAAPTSHLLTSRATQVLSTASVTRWSHTLVDGTSSFTYTMVGKDPTVVQATPSTTIKTELVPLIIKFAGDTWNPTVGDSCDTTSALIRTENSPIFKSKAYTLGGTATGSGQYVDIFQRANYWADTKPTGINPGYHVKLGLKVLPAVTINVPLADAATGTTPCGNHLLGAVENGWLDNYLRSTVIPGLKAQGVGPKTFPLFLLGNVVQYVGNTANCCVLGYHNSYQVTAGVQTFGIAMYDNSANFTGSQDVSALSHEVAEWMDDPFGNNPTRPWGNIGQVTGCQNNLEVGDPLSGTVQSVTTVGHAYHVQELAFTSWFYHQTPSSGINGWYSNYGTFTAAAATCP